MLKGIHPLLHADLLHALAAMGHGDELVIADANFPAASVGRRVLHAAGATAPAMLDAVLTVFPLDTFVRPAALTMAVHDTTNRPSVISISWGGPESNWTAQAMTSFDQALQTAAALGVTVCYERARSAFAVVRTGELRPYGNILLVKGVINAYPAARG